MTKEGEAVDIEQIILSHLSKEDSIENSWDFALMCGLDHQLVIGAVKSLLVDSYVVDKQISSAYWELTAEGEKALKSGSPELIVYNKIASSEGSSVTVSELNKLAGDMAKVGLGACMKNKWVKKDGDNLVKVAETVVDEVANQLKSLSEDNTGSGIKDADLKNLKRRQMIEQKTRKYVSVTRGPEYKEKRVRKMPALTKEMLIANDGSDNTQHWSTVEFKKVNLNSMGANPMGGNFHPLLKVRAEFRRILMDMGFEEMPTSKWVESSFWNFDSLFQPQSHPARDAHDTFFMKDPSNCTKIPEDYYKVVKNTHENGGGFGSIGYGCNFKREEAEKNVLRTHTTAVSAQMLYQLGQEYVNEGTFTPKKYFSVDRVFRNEAMDATHLCEFHQVEGLIADRNLTLGHLIGTIKTFFEKIGITQLRFKPAYNPYTEPSLEIFGYHPELGKWTEIGNSGMFRPEMLRPMGLPEDVRVIAWGLSLERPTMIKYKIENIRDLFGHKADLLKQRNAPIARF